MNNAMLITIPVLFLSGCANFTPPASSNALENGKSYWLNYDSTRRGSLVLAKDAGIKTCAEPAPDVALSFVNTLKGSLTTPSGLSASDVDVAFNATALALAGRDDVVLLAREALFRICEASINGTVNAADVKPLFQDVFVQIKEIAVAQAATAKGKAETAKAELDRAKIQLQLLQQTK